MALDWNKPVHLSDLRGKNSTGYPTKTTMNLCVSGSQELDLRSAVPVALLLIVLVALFVKFGVVDQLAQVAAKQSELTQQQAILTADEAKLANYNKVEEEYDGYAVSTNSGSVSAITALDLVDTYVAPSATVSSINLKDNTLTLTLTNVNLDTVGALTTTLQGRPIVSGVTVSTAATSTTDTQNVVATMIISLVASNG